MNKNKIIGGDLVAFYHKEKCSNRFWYFNAQAKAGFLLERYGIAALAVANELMDGSSNQIYLFYRVVFGILQNELCSEG